MSNFILFPVRGTSAGRSCCVRNAGISFVDQVCSGCEFVFQFVGCIDIDVSACRCSYFYETGCQFFGLYQGGSCCFDFQLFRFPFEGYAA